MLTNREYKKRADTSIGLQRLCLFLLVVNRKLFNDTSFGRADKVDDVLYLRRFFNLFFYFY